MSQRSPGESAVRSSSQSTTLTPASTGVTAPASMSWPGRLGRGRRALGSGGAGTRGISLSGLVGGCELGRIEVLTDPVEWLAREPRREAPQLVVDRVARADLDQAGRAVHAGVEAVQRTDRRAAGDHAAEVVHAAVARADESLGGGDEAHRTTEVHAARGQRHELVVLVLG